MHITEAHFLIPPDVEITSGMKEPCSISRTHKIFAFGIHEDGMLMLTALSMGGGKHVHQKMPADDDHPKNLVH